MEPTDDCEICVQSLYSWVNEATKTNESLKLYGIFFQEKKGNYFRFMKYLEDTDEKVEWIETNQKQLFLELEKLSKKQGGPFALKWRGKHLDYIEKINETSYH